MNVQMKKMAVACAMALGAASGSALAHGPSVTPDVTINMGGASAQDAIFVSLIKGFMLAGADEYYNNKTVEAPGSVVGFFSVAGGTQNDGGDFRAVFGTWKSDGTALSGKKVLVVKRSLGGSYFGVMPIQNNETVRYMNVNGTNCTLGDVSPVAGKYVCNTGAAALIDVVPDVGLSDVNPELFLDTLNQQAIAEAAGDSTSPMNAVDNITATSLFAVGFGAQVNASSSVTSITKSQYAGIAAGTISKWGQIDPTLPNAANDIILCRRANGSGTQAMSNAYFLNVSCGNAVSPADASFGTRIKENLTTTAVRACISNNADAIGWISLEDDPISFAANRKWIEVAGTGALSNAQSTSPQLSGSQQCTVGGATPCNTDNIKLGKSDMYSEQAFIEPNTVAGNTKRSAAELNAFISAFKTNVPLTATLANRAKAGILALSTNAAANTVMDWSRQGSMCNPSQYQR